MARDKVELGDIQESHQKITSFFSATSSRQPFISKDNKAVADFIKLMETTCQANGVRFVPVYQETIIMIYGGTQTLVSGYFDDKAEGGPILTYATKRPFESWFGVAVHEFHHMEQWLQKFQPILQIHQYARVWKWLNHELEMSAEDVEIDIKANLIVELDAEQRTLAAIQKYSLPLDPKIYAKQANACLYSYQYAQKFRDWLGGERAPYRNLKIVAAMPDHLDNDYTKINEDYLDLYVKIYQGQLPQIIETEKLQLLR